MAWKDKGSKYRQRELWQMPLLLTLNSETPLDADSRDGDNERPRTYPGPPGWRREV